MQIICKFLKILSCKRDHPYITSGKWLDVSGELGPMGSENDNFVDVQYCVNAEIVGGSESLKMCWRNIGMVPNSGLI